MLEAVLPTSKVEGPEALRYTLLTVKYITPYPRSTHAMIGSLALVNFIFTMQRKQQSAAQLRLTVWMRLFC